MVGIDAPPGTTANIASWAKLDINIKDVNAQIAVTGTAVTVAEDNVHPGVPVTANIALSMTDADDISNLRTLTLTSLPSATFGTLQYWNGSAYVTATTGLVFTQAQLTDGTHPALRFSYNNSTEPTDQDGILVPAQAQTSFTVSVSDNHPGPLAATTATATVNISITPSNDAPVLTTHDMTVLQGSTNNGISNTAGTGNINVADPDSTASKRIYTISQDPARGYLTLNGVLIGRGSTFTEAQLAAGLVKYSTNDLQYTGSDNFKFFVSDGDGGLSGEGTIAVTINADGTVNPPGPDGGEYCLLS